MGFRKDAYATVWEVTPVNDTSTKIRISISRKNKTSGEYEQEFSGFCMVYGTAPAKKAALLKQGDRIRLGDVDVTTTYNKEKNVTYTNYKIFDILPANEVSSTESSKRGLNEDYSSPQSVVDGGEMDDRELPF